MDWMPTNRNRKDYISCWYLLARQKDFRFIYMLHSSFGISCEIGCFYLPMSGDKKKSNPFGFIFIWMQCLQEISEEIKKTRAKIFDVSFMVSRTLQEKKPNHWNHFANVGAPNRNGCVSVPQNIADHQSEGNVLLSIPIIFTPTKVTNHTNGKLFSLEQRSIESSLIDLWSQTHIILLCLLKEKQLWSSKYAECTQFDCSNTSSIRCSLFKQLRDEQNK